MAPEWYVGWFDSSYYHLLYDKRNDEEANELIDHLCEHLKLGKGSEIWDLACGRGRHSLALGRKGYKVTGTDLSVNNIRHANSLADGNVKFEVHDMREKYGASKFDAVFNLFTSIGYFDDMNDNISVFRNVAEALKPAGIFVVDFFNASAVVKHFKAAYDERREGVTFTITKKIENNKIVKCINFSDRGRDFYFEETVGLLKKKDFMDFAAKSGLRMTEVFGNYRLEPFSEESSERLIMIFRKEVKE